MPQMPEGERGGEAEKRPFIPVVGQAHYISGAPWGFFTSAGFWTAKAALGVGATVYKTTSVKKG